MKVVILNTSEQTGGAAIAASRLKEALTGSGVKARMLTMHKESESLTVAPAYRHPWMGKLNFVLERLPIWRANGWQREGLFDVDTAQRGIDVTQLPEFREADVVHLHWVNQGFLSMRSLERIVKSGKRVVWTMHDMWPFTGVCHYAHECRKFELACHDCPRLRRSGPHDLSHRTFLKKPQLHALGHISYVACSEWLQREALQSSLLREAHVTAIPNPINTHRYSPRPKDEARRRIGVDPEGRYLLFSAYRTTLPIKGLAYFREACRKLAAERSELCQGLSILAVGKDSELLAQDFPLKVVPMGYVDSQQLMADIYSAADAFVIPSLQDNLPNTIMEALASGVPCIGFRVGGIPEMIVHRESGYLAEPRSAADLMQGLAWLLGESNYDAVAQAARQFAVQHYAEQTVAKQYINLYQHV